MAIVVVDVLPCQIVIALAAQLMGPLSLARVARELFAVAANIGSTVPTLFKPIRLTHRYFLQQ